jgi:hypothetical protein
VTKPPQHVPRQKQIVSAGAEKELTERAGAVLQGGLGLADAVPKAALMLASEVTHVLNPFAVLRTVPSLKESRIGFAGVGRLASG